MNALHQSLRSVVQRSALFLPTVFVQQTRCMSKFISNAAKKRLVLTTKRAHKGFYKGKGGTKEGRLSRKGRFVLDPLKRMEIIAPDLTGFMVRINVQMILRLGYSDKNVHLT
jgi:hypothetical protein